MEGRRATALSGSRSENACRERGDSGGHTATAMRQTRPPRRKANRQTGGLGAVGRQRNHAVAREENPLSNSPRAGRSARHGNCERTERRRTGFKKDIPKFTNYMVPDLINVPSRVMLSAKIQTEIGGRTSCRLFLRSCWKNGPTRRAGSAMRNVFRSLRLPPICTEAGKSSFFVTEPSLFLPIPCTGEAAAKISSGASCSTPRTCC